jgi:hypothetical protein
MFADIGEQDHVFSLLDELAKKHAEYDLTYLTGNKSTLNVELKNLIKAIDSEEQKAIKQNPRLKPGFSFQSELLYKLQLYLTSSSTPPALLANLMEIKIALLQAMVIGLNIKTNTLQLLADVGKAVKDGGKRAHEETYGTEEEKIEKREKWQLWVNEEIAKHQQHSFVNIKKLVVKNHPGEVSEAQLKRYTKDTRKT